MLIKKPRIIIITGANRGLGKRSAHVLAKSGYTIIMACRNTAAALPVRDEIRAESGNNEVYVIELDLSDRHSISSFVKNFHTRFPFVNVLINNAGIITRYPEITRNGLNSVIMTNYLGPYLLTRLLIPFFEPDGDNRIINLISGIYPYGNYQWEKLNKYRWVRSYAVSKCLMLRVTVTLADELRERGITVNAVDPGVINTSIMFTNKWYDIIIHLILLPFYVSMEKGAETVIFLATSQKIKDSSGQCFYKCRIKRIGRRHRDPGVLRELSERSHEWLQKGTICGRSFSEKEC